MALNGSAVCYIIFQLPYPSAFFTLKKYLMRFVTYTYRDQETTDLYCTWYAVQQYCCNPPGVQYSQAHNQTKVTTAQEARVARGSCVVHA